jgi:hypothetical protein
VIEPHLSVETPWGETEALVFETPLEPTVVVETDRLRYQPLTNEASEDPVRTEVGGEAI